MGGERTDVVTFRSGRQVSVGFRRTASLGASRARAWRIDRRRRRKNRCEHRIDVSPAHANMGLEGIAT